MASIQISQLNLTGYDLLHDEESFLNELANQDTQTIMGGGKSHRNSGSHGGYSHHDYSHHDYSHRDYSHRDYSHHDYSYIYRDDHWH